MCKRLIYLLLLRPSVQSIMGATETFRSIFPVGSSLKMPIFPVLSMLRVCGRSLRVPVSLAVAEAAYGRQECHVASKVAMPYIKIRKQSDGSTRYTAIVRLRRGKTSVHQKARAFAHRAAAITWAKHREVAHPRRPSSLARS
jgi:hypothetical protein